MKRLSTFFWTLILMTVAPVMVYGQTDDCPAIVKKALDATDTICSSTARNQACFGNINLNVESQANTAAFTFTKPGDLISVDGIKTMTLSPLDTQAGTWGVALMKIQANLLDTLPEQNVTFVLFGDVEIDNAVDQIPTLDVIIKQTANVRQAPSKTAAVVASGKSGTALVADGRSEDTGWLRIHSTDLSLQGWVSAPLVKSDGDLKTLAVISADAPRFSPMQAFYFKSGLNDAPCSAAPDSGILIQAPKGAGNISLTADDVQITLNSTAYIQAQAGGEMTISMIEGQGMVTAAGMTTLVPAGTRVRIPLDNALRANGQPISPEPYDDARIAVLPIGLLTDAITTTPALTVDAIATAIAEIQPLPGKWAQPASRANVTPECGQGATIAMQATTFRIAEGPFDLAQMLGTSSDGTQSIKSMVIKYQGLNSYTIDVDVSSARAHYALQVVSPTRMHVDSLITSMVVKGCVITASDLIEYTGK